MRVYLSDSVKGPAIEEALYFSQIQVVDDPEKANFVFSHFSETTDPSLENKDVKVIKVGEEADGFQFVLNHRSIGFMVESKDWLSLQAFLMLLDADREDFFHMEVNNSVELTTVPFAMQSIFDNLNVRKSLKDKILLSYNELMTNALNYGQTIEGTKTVARYKLIPFSTDKHLFAFEIIDSNGLLKYHHFKKIFENKAQLKVSDDPTKKGAGIGLNLVAQNSSGIIINVKENEYSLLSVSWVIEDYKEHFRKFFYMRME